MLKIIQKQKQSQLSEEPERLDSDKVPSPPREGIEDSTDESETEGHEDETNIMQILEVGKGDHERGLAPALAMENSNEEMKMDSVPGQYFEYGSMNDIRSHDIIGSHEGFDSHILRPLYTLPCYKGAHGSDSRSARRRCRICQKKTSFFCFTCSSVENNLVIPVCNPMKVPHSGKGDRGHCYFEHVNVITNNQIRWNLTSNLPKHRDHSHENFYERERSPQEQAMLTRQYPFYHSHSLQAFSTLPYCMPTGTTKQPQGNGAEPADVNIGVVPAASPIPGGSVAAAVDGEIPEHLDQDEASGVKRIQRRCRICHKKTSYFCAKCSVVSSGIFVALCNPLKTSQPDCFYKHTENIEGPVLAGIEPIAMDNKRIENESNPPPAWLTVDPIEHHHLEGEGHTIGLRAENAESQQQSNKRKRVHPGHGNASAAEVDAEGNPTGDKGNDPNMKNVLSAMTSLGDANGAYEDESGNPARFGRFSNIPELHANHLLQPLHSLPFYQLKSTKHRDSDAHVLVEPEDNNNIESIISTPGKSKHRDIRRRCRICHNKTAYYCVNCSSVEHEMILPLCNPLKVSQSGLMSTCYAKHIELQLLTLHQ